MEHINLYDWLEVVFSSLPKVSSKEYQAIWQTGVLRFKKQKEQADFIDEINARLVCTALSEKQQLLIVLPDNSPHRGPLLFATALLLDSMNRIQNHTYGKQVLYFSSTIGIREHLSQMYIKNLCLASIFSQEYIKRGVGIEQLAIRDSHKKRQKVNSIPFSLPKVFCVYSPADPVVICQQNKANWLAVDCANDTKLTWLKPLIEEAKSNHITLITWVQNPHSQVIEDFRVAGGKIFTWPAIDATKFIPIGTPITTGLREIFGNVQQHRVQPIIVKSSRAEIPIKSLQLGNAALSKVANVARIERTNRLVISAIQISWRYLHSLENLCVPLYFFETEVKNYWGASSIARTREVLCKYISMLNETDTQFYAPLIELQGHLQKAHDHFEMQEPPLWKELSNLCVENIANDTARLIIFPTVSSRKIFELSLLAYYNITKEDLKQLHVGLVSLRELYNIQYLLSQEEKVSHSMIHLLANLPSLKLKWEYMMVGLPTWALTPYINPLLHEDEFKVIIYPYQLPILARRIERWDAVVYPSIWECAMATAAIANCDLPLIDSKNEPQRIVLHDIQERKVDQSRALVPAKQTKVGIWEPYDPLEEFAVLMGVDTDDDTFTVFSGTHGRIDDIVVESLTEYVEEAWHIAFNNGMYVLLSTDEKVNVIITTNIGSKTDERFASSLRAGDKIVFIHGLREQSLLNLVISRVYRNPIVALHVKLVEKWQEDFATAFIHPVSESRKWDLNSLFQEMKAKGSRISNPQPLRNWLRGETLRPQDEEDLRRIAEILSLDFVRNHYKRIHQAGGRLAGLHIGLSKRLNNWLSQDAPDIAANMVDQNDVIDEQLGLTFQDFRDSLSILQVKSMQREKGPFMRNMLGHLEREGIS